MNRLPRTAEHILVRVGLLAVLWMLGGCCIEGSGKIEQTEISVEPFVNIDLDLPATVRVHNRPKQLRVDCVKKTRRQLFR